MASIVGGRTVYPDDGGVLVQLTDTWATTGPFRVRLVDANGADHPSGGYCWGGIPGQGEVCYANHAKDLLSFSLPTLPPGLYTIRVEWGATWQSSVVVDETIRIDRRMRSPSTWRLRSRLPYPAAGPRRARGEELLT